MQHQLEMQKATPAYRAQNRCSLYQILL